MISSAGGESRVRMAILASRFTGAAKSRGAPSIMTASAALARPGPIALAMSAPETPRGKWRAAPSGSVIVIESAALASGMGAGLSQGKRGGNRLYRQVAEIVAAENRDARAARRRQGGIGRSGIKHGRGCAAGDDQMHRTGIVADGIDAGAAERHQIAEVGAADQIMDRRAIAHDLAAGRGIVRSPH